MFLFVCSMYRSYLVSDVVLTNKHFNDWCSYLCVPYIDPTIGFLLISMLTNKQFG